MPALCNASSCSSNGLMVRAQCTPCDEDDRGNSERTTPLWMPWWMEPNQRKRVPMHNVSLGALMEQGNTRTDFNRKGKSTPNQLLYLPYLVAHNDWRNVSRWIHNVPLDGRYVNQFGEFVIEDNSSAASVVFGLYDTLRCVCSLNTFHEEYDN